MTFCIFRPCICSGKYDRLCIHGTFLHAISVVTNCVVFVLDGCSGDTQSGPSLEVTNSHKSKVSQSVLHASLLWYSSWCKTFELVADLNFLDFCTNNALLSVIVLIISSSIDNNLVLVDNMLYGPIFWGSNFKYKAVASWSTAFLGNVGRST